MSPMMADRERLAKLVQSADECGINTLYVVVWNQGRVNFPSEVLTSAIGPGYDRPRAECDVLATLIELAHARKMRVLAWFEFGFASSYNDPTGGHLLRAKPHWAARDSAGKIASKNRFQWMNSFHPEVQQLLADLMKEVVTKYDLDGVQGDDRLPACPSSAGYDEWTVAEYRREHQNADPPQDYHDRAWIDWRSERLNQFMERLHRELKALRPELVISSAPSLFPWSKAEYLQDWPTWVERGWVDEISPQIYVLEEAKYAAELERILTAQVPPAKHGLVWPGILVRTGTFGPTTEALQAMVAENRKRGIEGEVFFYDAALRTHREFMEELYP